MAKDPYKYFRVEARELVDGLTRGVIELQKGAGTADAVVRLLRLAHTLKGAARVVKLPKIAEAAHVLEDALAERRESGAPLSHADASELLGLLDGVALALDTLESKGDAPRSGGAPAAAGENLDTLRVELADLDALARRLGEASVRVSALQRRANELERARAVADALTQHISERARSNGARSVGQVRARPLLDELREVLAGLQRGLVADAEGIARELSDAADISDRLRQVPAQSIFSGLERTARDAAQTLGKRVDLLTGGGHVRLDANVLSALEEGLSHVVRNAVTHGIEPEAERTAAGKPPAGTVRVTFERLGNRVVVSCADDGQGIDVEAVRRVAIARRLIGPNDAKGWNLERALAVLQRGGVSTSEKVTELAGRGVGLDVARTAANRLKGTMTLASQPGEGLSVRIEAPVSVASLRALLVEASGQIASIPLDAVLETVRVKDTEIAQTAEGRSLVHDGKVVPFLPLERVLNRGGALLRRNAWSAVIVAAAQGRAAVGVDRLVGAAPVVMRALPHVARPDPSVAGASLDGDGHPQLVLDPGGLVAMAWSVASSSDAPAVDPSEPVLVVDDSLTTRMLEQSILESAGYVVDLAVSGEDALEKARKRRYSVFIVDVEMPGMDGFEFVARTRADPDLKETPAILVTSRNAPEDRRRGQEAGARGYIVKGEFDQHVLLETIRELVSQS